MRENIEKIFQYQWKAHPSLREKAWRLLAYFLIFMLAFTFLSRSADSLTIAQVVTEGISERAIEHKVEASGKVEENGEQAINIEPGIRIQSVHVKQGDRIKKGDILLELDLDQLEEMILLKKKEIKELELTNESLDSAENAEKKNQDTARKRATEDYQSAKENGDRAVKTAKQNWDKARKALADYRKNKKSLKKKGASTEEKALKTAENQWETAKKQLENVNKKLDTAIKQLEEAKKQRTALEKEQREKIKEGLEKKQQELSGNLTASEKTQLEVEIKAEYRDEITSAKEAEQTAQAEIRELRKEMIAAKEKEQSAKEEVKMAKEQEKAAETVDNTQEEESQLAAAVTETKAAYQEALNSRKESMLAAKRALEDANAAKGEDKTDEINDLKIDTANLELSKLTSLKETDGKVKAPVDGVVTNIAAITGSNTTEDAAVLLADLSSGTRFTAQVPKEKQKYLSVGAEASLMPDGSSDTIENLSIESVTVNQEDDSLLNVSILLKKGELSIGQTAEMTVVQKSSNYPATLSLTAVRQDNSQNYVLVMRQKDTVLGEEWFAERVDITVKEKNESYAAIGEGALDEEQQIILSSNKSIKEGDRVRLMEQQNDDN